MSSLNDLLKINDINLAKRWKEFFRKQSITSNDTCIEDTPLFILFSLRLESIILRDKEIYELLNELYECLIKKLHSELDEKNIDDIMMMCAMRLKYKRKDPNDDWFANFLRKSKLEHLLVEREEGKQTRDIDMEIQTEWEQVKKFVPLSHMISYCTEVFRKHGLLSGLFLDNHYLF